MEPREKPGTWNELLDDRAAIERMTAVLLDSCSDECGGIPISTPQRARELVCKLLMRAKGPYR
jgi:hypothetical protein